MAAHFASVGHSNRPVEEFIDMLRSAQIGLIVDVRSFPKSRNNPDYNTDVLPETLGKVQIGYHHIPALGGRRSRQAGVDDTINAMWRVRSFQNYSDYALGEAFEKAFAELLELGREKRLAMMCSEAVWWRCHRRIITDHLLAGGHAVDHLMGVGRTDTATMTPGAKVREDGKVVYPAA